MDTRKRVAILLLFSAVLFALGAGAQGEDNGGKDHPSVPRFPGMVLGDSIETDFDGFDFPLDEGREKTKRVEGRSWVLNYYLKEGARRPSPLEIVRNYTKQFASRGGRVLFQSPVDSGGGWATLVMPLSGGERYLLLEVTDQANICNLRIIETAAMQQKVEFSADQMAEEIKSAGKLTLRGILFDTGKADIKPESNPLLDEVARMLKTNGDLKLRIEGHTDNVGTPSANLQLSKGRASAVKAALVARGIVADRLTTDGFGGAKPVADNSTPDGRTQNRRVELVKQ